MQLTVQQIQQYHADGYLLLPGVFNEEEIQLLREEMQHEFAQESPARIMEKNRSVIRSVYGSHARNDVFRRLSQHPRLVGPALQILGDSVYVYQFKINAKAGFEGDTWEWHQDFIFWFHEDGMPRPRALTAAVYLDEANEFNGPMLLLPGSHQSGMIDAPPLDEHTPHGAEVKRDYDGKPAWISNLTARLKYSLDRDVVSGLVRKCGITSTKGPRGSLLLFDCNLVHASSANMSPFDRALALITYNSTTNAPAQSKQQRPEFLVSRDSTPIVPLSDDALLQKISS